MYRNLILKSFIIFLFSILVINCNNDNKHYDLKEFAIKDTSRITKFRISDTENNTVGITRENDKNEWLIEGTNFKASRPSVELLMETFYRIRVKQDVPNSAFNTVINRLSVKYKKVEIFTNSDNPTKTWYIGSPTQDHLGTYMLLQEKNIKSSLPYITYKPGMYGSLDVRFFTGIENWRSTKVFNYSNANEITSIKVKFIDNPNESYSVKRQNNKVILTNENEQLITLFDTVQVKHYLTHYNNINYNKNMMFKKSVRDSILAIPPNYYFELRDKRNNTKIVNFWKIKDDNSETGWDKEYGVITINDEKELLRVQYFNWDVLLKPLSYFKKDIIK